MFRSVSIRVGTSSSLLCTRAHTHTHLYLLGRVMHDHLVEVSNDFPFSAPYSQIRAEFSQFEQAGKISSSLFMTQKPVPT